MAAGDGDEFGGDAGAREVIGQRFFRGDERVIVFLVDHERGGAGDRAPVVEDARDVMDERGVELFDEAQGEIPILAALVAGAETADGAEARGPENGEVAGVVLAEEEIGVPVGLEVGIEAAALFVDLVLVGVEEIERGLGGEGEGDFGEGGGGEFVVVVEERGELAGGEGERGIRGVGDVSVLLAMDDFDAGIAFGVVVEDAAHVRGGRGVVRDTEFPVRIELGADRLDRFHEPRLGRVVGRHQHGDERALQRREGIDAGAQGNDGGGIGRVETLNPSRVIATQVFGHERSDAREGGGEATPDAVVGARFEHEPFGGFGGQRVVGGEAAAERVGKVGMAGGDVGAGETGSRVDDVAAGADADRGDGGAAAGEHPTAKQAAGGNLA